MKAGSRVLDVANRQRGTGAGLRHGAPERPGTSWQPISLPGMLAIARERAAALAIANVEFRQ